MKITINISRIVRYIRKNVGVQFVIIFELLLLVYAFILMSGYSNLANEVAIYAYYSLVISVILQLVSSSSQGWGGGDGC